MDKPVTSTGEAPPQVPQSNNPIYRLFGVDSMSSLMAKVKETTASILSESTSQTIAFYKSQLSSDLKGFAVGYSGLGVVLILFAGLAYLVSAVYNSWFGEKEEDPKGITSETVNAPEKQQKAHKEAEVVQATYVEDDDFKAIATVVIDPVVPVGGFIERAMQRMELNRMMNDPLGIDAVVSGWSAGRL